MDEHPWKVGMNVTMMRHAKIAHIVEIERLTKTQVVLASGDRFRRKDGEMVGGDDVWDGLRIRPTTEADLLAARHKRNLHEAGRAVAKLEASIRTQEWDYERLAEFVDSIQDIVDEFLEDEA